MLSKDELQALIGELAPAIAREPRVRPTIRMGAIGHRRIAVDAQAPTAGAVEEVLAAIRKAAESALEAGRARADFHGDLDLVLLSPLAEGADRMAAEAAQRQGWRLGAILPLAVADYEASFDLGERGDAVAAFRALLCACELPAGHGVFVLDGSAAPDQRDDAFLRCAKALARWSDILIAVCEEERQSSQSWYSARQAIEEGAPVVAIDPGRPEDYAIWIDGARVPRQERDGALATLVRAILAPSGGDAQHRGLAAYIGEHVRCDPAAHCDFEYAGPYRARTAAPLALRAVGWLNRLLARLGKRVPAAHEKEPALEDLALDRTMAAPIVELFLRYQRADAVANAYAELYRSAQIVVAMLGLATVVFAAISSEQPLLPALELLCLGAALTIVYCAHRQQWLDRWLNYRLIAEVLRYTKFLLLTGQPSPFSDLRGSGEDAMQSWTRDHVQHVLRAHPLTVPGRDVEATDALRAYVLARCIDDQIRYHEHTAPGRRRSALWLKRAGLWASAITLAVVFAKLLVALDGHTLQFATLLPAEGAGFVGRSLHFLAIVLPAVTAALLALRAYGEHEVVAKRSSAMIGQLRRERRAVAATGDILTLGEALSRVVRLLLREVDGWLELFADKHLE
ncbi:MAG: hypothetical protein KGL26_02155 [Pseudomonadota bacterium]|nr:hypothetical protein [Pseudomonadota bacterium]